MVPPLPSERPDRLIETPLAGPLTTTWKDSNSLRAAASAAAVGALAGTAACGRTLVVLGAVQTCAAGATAGDKAMAAAMTRCLFTSPPWLAALRDAGGSAFRLPNEEGEALLPRLVWRREWGGLGAWRLSGVQHGRCTTAFYGQRLGFLSTPRAAGERLSALTYEEGAGWPGRKIIFGDAVCLYGNQPDSAAPVVTLLRALARPAPAWQFAIAGAAAGTASAPTPRRARAARARVSRPRSAPVQPRPGRPPD